MRKATDKQIACISIRRIKCMLNPQLDTLLRDYSLLKSLSVAEASLVIQKMLDDNPYQIITLLKERRTT